MNTAGGLRRCTQQMVMSSPYLLREARRIAVLRALRLGDLLCAVPALRALRTAAPHAKITLIGLPWAHELVSRFAQYLDDFLALPTCSGLPETAGQSAEGEDDERGERGEDGEGMAGFLELARARQFDLAIQLHDSGRVSNPLILALAARRAAGYYVAGQPCPDSQSFLPWCNDEREVLRCLRLVTHLGAPAVDRRLEFPLHPGDRLALQALPGVQRLQARRYVCVHPGAHFASRRWPAPRFAATADALAARGYEIVLTGSAGERAVIEEVAAGMRHPAIDLAGATRLGALAQLLQSAQLLVANDTGVAHLAIAVGTPSVIVSSGGDAQRWAPVNAIRHRMLHYTTPCRPCLHAQCPIVGHPCAHGVEVQGVLNAATPLLARQRAA
jgi:ADP-heptose:LPS heptosyltransferase